MFVVLNIIGCSATVAPYKSSNTNSSYFEQVDTKIKIVSSKNSISDATMFSRMKPIYTDEDSFSLYIVNAFNKEIMYGLKGKKTSQEKTLTFELQDIGLTTSLFGSYWEFKALLSSKNGKNMNIEYKYDFPSSFNGELAVKYAARSFQPAVQTFIGEIIYNDKFQELIKD